MVNVAVEIGTVRGFVLDDPVAGVLDNTDYGLGGLRYVDVSDKVNSVSIDRGKSRDLERYSAGSINVSFNNQDRFFDPIAGTAIDPIPWAPIRCTMDGTAQFVGVVEDWNYTYDPGGVSYAQVIGKDEFIQLARQNIVAGGTALEQLTGARVTAILDQFTVAWPADRRNIDTGVTTLEAQLFEETNALEYLQLVEATEQGQLFMAKNGDLTFSDRNSAAPTTDTLVLFADDGTGVPFHSAVVNYGSELLVNRAVVESAGGTAVATNELSEVTYGVLEETYSVLNTSTASLTSLAEYVVAQYAQPEYRFESLKVTLDQLTLAQKATVLNLELSSVIEVKFTPNGIGDPIEKYYQVIKVGHEVSIDRHDVTFGLASLDFAPLVLTDAEFGKLDIYHLAF
jgi:hypothetical protein